MWQVMKFDFDGKDDIAYCEETCVTNKSKRKDDGTVDYWTDVEVKKSIEHPHADRFSAVKDNYYGREVFVDGANNFSIDAVYTFICRRVDR